MGRAQTEEQKAASSTFHKAHWARCGVWGEILGVHRAVINAHWRCCFSDEPWEGHAGSLTQAQIDEKREVFEPCHAQQTERWHRDQAECRRAEAERNRDRRLRAATSDEIPDLSGRIKVMLWAIKTVGGPENAQDALERAIRSLEDE